MSQTDRKRGYGLADVAVSMTLDIYGHLLPGWQREAAEVFAKAMSQGS